MPGVTRKGLDTHVGHASPTPNPFHCTSYAVGSPTTFANGAAVVRIGDSTACGDPAVGGSPTVFADGIAWHRIGDGTGGHGSWVPNSSGSGSRDVFADDGGIPSPAPPPPTKVSVTTNSNYKEYNEEGDLIKSGCSAYNWDTGECQD